MSTDFQRALFALSAYAESPENRIDPPEGWALRADLSYVCEGKREGKMTMDMLNGSGSRESENASPNLVK